MSGRAAVAVAAATALAGAAGVGLGGCRGGAAATTPAARCPTAPVRVTAQRELDRLRGCSRLAGLELRGAVPFELAPLAGLTGIDGDLVVRSTFALSGLRLPALTEVGGELAVVGNLALGGVYLPALARAGAIVIADDPVLTELMLPALVAVGRLHVARVASLELVDVSALPAVADLQVERAPRLTAWYGPTEEQVLSQP